MLGQTWNDIHPVCCSSPYSVTHSTWLMLTGCMVDMSVCPRQRSLHGLLVTSGELETFYMITTAGCTCVESLMFTGGGFIGTRFTASTQTSVPPPVAV